MIIGEFTFAAVSIAALMVSVPVVFTAGIAKLLVLASLYNDSNSLPNKKPDFLKTLEKIINDRKSEGQSSSYTASLFAKGINKIAQKVGEEAVELVIEAKDDNIDLFLNEAADLMKRFFLERRK